jgi:hypothetical protein
MAACTFLACTRSEVAKADAPAPAAATPAGSAIQGTVLEVLDASPYSYLRLKSAQGEIWAAVPAVAVKVGAPVTVQVQVKMDQFQSETLHRTFAVLYMGTLGGGALPAPGAPTAGMAAGAVQATAKAAHGASPLLSTEKVAKAAGAEGHTISELYAGKDALKDRPVVVRGKVMKYSAGIMGKAWIHLSDGSGHQQAKDYDLTVTTQDVAKVGEVVTVQGVLHINRDIGMGYVYPVIIEDAKIVH